MFTLTIAMYVITAIIIRICLKKFSEYKDRIVAESAVRNTMIAAFVISLGIFFDFLVNKRISLDGSFTPLGVLFSITGVVELVSMTSISFILPILWGEAIEMPSLNEGIGGIKIIVEIIGFIASILGIISFFNGV